MTETKLYTLSEVAKVFGWTQQRLWYHTHKAKHIEGPAVVVGKSHYYTEQQYLRLCDWHRKWTMRYK